MPKSKTKVAAAAAAAGDSSSSGKAGDESAKDAPTSDAGPAGDGAAAAAAGGDPPGKSDRGSADEGAEAAGGDGRKEAPGEAKGEGGAEDDAKGAKEAKPNEEKSDSGTPRGSGDRGVGGDDGRTRRSDASAARRSSDAGHPGRAPAKCLAEASARGESAAAAGSPSADAMATDAPSPASPAPIARQNPPTTAAPPAAAAPSAADADAEHDDCPDSRDTLLSVSFNQDGGCLAVGTGSGFRICNVHPFGVNHKRVLGGGGGGGAGGDGREEAGAGIAHIEMLFRTNLIALTGHASSARYPPNKVLIYDDHLQRTIGELSFRQRVLAARLRRDRIVVVLRDRVYVYNFSDLAMLDKVHTGDNPLGLIGISLDNGGVGGITVGVERAEEALGVGNASPRNNGMVLACPGTQRGQVRVELYGLRRTTFVDAHASALGALALSVDGSLLATASERGTVIRLFDTRGVTIGGGSGGAGASGAKGEAATAVSSSVPLREFRRGVERATIACLTFSLDSAWLGCASDHGTVHVFRTQDPDASSDARAKKTRSSSVAGKAVRMLPKLVSAPRKYLVDGVQSVAQVRGVPHPHACAFVPDRERTIAVAGTDEYGNGCLLLAEFGSADGDGEGKVDDTEARRLGYHRFFKCKSPASQTGRRRTKSRDSKKHAEETAVEGGAYIDDAPVDMKMNHISIGDENEDHFVPIDYEEK